MTDTRNRRYRFYSDPGHGWLRVHREDLQALGLGETITPYSHQYRDWCYLEEDCDAPAFLQAYRKKYNRRPTITESVCKVHQSKIRQYRPYQHRRTTVRQVLDPMRMGIVRNLLKAAAGRKMICDCGRVLDWSDTVLFTIPGGGATISCCKCWIAGSNAAFDKYGQVAVEQFHRFAEREQIDSAWNWHFNDGRMVKGARVVH